MTKWSVLLCGLFSWAKELNAKDSHKEIFPVYSGKCLSRKAVETGSRNSLKDVRISHMMKRRCKIG
jgi:hypothetical protein